MKWTDKLLRTSALCASLWLTTIQSFLAHGNQNLNQTQASNLVTYPPQFTIQPSRRFLYEIGDSLKLPFVADSYPKANYTWELNGKPFDPVGTDNAVVNLQGTGTLVFDNPRSEFNGFYRCKATNSFGTAVSNTVQLVNASLGSFPRWPVRPISKTAGDSLRIRCPRPESFPEPIIYWSKKTSTGSVNAGSNRRVTVDPEGGLNFAYVEVADSGEYECHVYNSFLRKGNSRAYKLQVTSSKVNGHRPEWKPAGLDNWFPRSSETFIKGQEARLMCIYSGKPTPYVSWKRTDGKEISATAMKRGEELYFPSIGYADAGPYECEGSNLYRQTPRKIQVLVAVQGHVEWVHKPKSVTKGENETVTFVCKGTSEPAPFPPMWYINGDRVTASSGDRIIGDEEGLSTTFTVKNLRKDRDTMAIQCNITNYLPGSWVFASFYLNVQ